MIRLIGGPAPCGKSTLARKVSALSDGQALSLDNMRRAFIPLASEAVRSALLVAPKESEHTSAEWLAILCERDRVQWKGTRAYLEAAATNNDDVVVEGCLWPDMVTELERGYRAVFLVDTSPAHVDHILAAAHSQTGHNNWMANWSDERLRAWAQYNIERSKLTKQLAVQHNQQVFDITDDGIAAAQTAALAYLMAPLDAKP